MFGRRSPAAKIAAVDRAFDQAEANAKLFGKEAAGHIVRQYRAGAIDRAGVDELVELALEQSAAKAGGVPKALLRQILQALHKTVRQELAGAGIDIPELTA